MADSTQISALIVERLAVRETRLLSLVVAVRSSLGRSEKIKGDLSEMVKSALRKLEATQAVVQSDGLYSLPPRK